MNIKRISFVCIAVAIISTSVFAQSRRERKEARMEESAKPKTVAGGVKVPSSKSVSGVPTKSFSTGSSELITLSILRT
jgi:hypothetical protein